MSRSSKGQCYNDACLWKGQYLSNRVCEYEVNQLASEKVNFKETLAQIVHDAGRLPDKFTNLIFFGKIRLKGSYSVLMT